MGRGIERPVFTSILGDIGDLRPEAGSLYIAGVSAEERSRHSDEWREKCDNIRFADVVAETPYEVAVEAGEGTWNIGLRAVGEIGRFLEAQHRDVVYLDITGLPHHVWVPLLRGVRARSGKKYCVYVEPADYRVGETPTADTIFDLSESIRGIEPLPGLATLGTGVADGGIFVPLLGFEGARFTHVLDALDPEPEDIFPVIGVPGFRPEYPFHTYIANSLKLEETRSFSNVRYAAANCPFALYQVLEDLATSQNGRRMMIAPIGTKPHALGAVLYYLDYADATEIVYDHPVRRRGRTGGANRVCVYNLSLLPRLRAEPGRPRRV